MDQNEAGPFISVVVPVYRDREKLRLCLAALARQSYPDTLYEVLVVDNDAKSAPPFIMRCSSHGGHERGYFASRPRALMRLEIAG
jgi:cellulose synthase/poly-beta-1,6-N-acetylglucosamine synthase-like glycosyltransferase